MSTSGEFFDGGPGNEDCFGELADYPRESEGAVGYSRYRDQATYDLRMLADTWLSLHKQYQATILRSKRGNPLLEPILTKASADTKEIRERVGKQMTKLLRQHPMHDWLKEYRSTGVHVIRLLAVIGDPLRFPGKVCSQGHHLPSDWEGLCPVRAGEKGDSIEDLKPCLAPVGDVRRGTGSRSLWHYLGVHADENGKAPRKRKGVQCSWSPIGRSILLQPDGLADQIVRHRKEPWRSIYDEAKARLIRERGVVDGTGEAGTSCGDTALRKNGDFGPPHENELDGGIPSDAGEDFERDCARGITKRGVGTRPEREIAVGPAQSFGDAEALRESVNSDGIAEGGGAVVPRENGFPTGALRPFQIDALARKIAVKAMVADLLAEWKRVVST